MTTPSPMRGAVRTSDVLAATPNPIRDYSTPLLRSGCIGAVGAVEQWSTTGISRLHHSPSVDPMGAGDTDAATLTVEREAV
jgi:hypothetical protein